MGSRFIISLLSAFVATLAILAGAGYAITQAVVAPPREIFRAGSFEFELAHGWWCELDDRGGNPTYVCVPPGEPPHAATVIMAVKERGPQDNLQAYETHLRNPLKEGDPNSGQAISAGAELGEVRRTKLGQAEWVETRHLGSELPSFRTYYLATVTSHLGILVTASIHKDHEEKYISQIKEMMSKVSLYQR